MIIVQEWLQERIAIRHFDEPVVGRTGRGKSDGGRFALFENRERGD